MDENEKVLFVVSPNVAVRMLEEDEQSSESMLICMFAPEDTALVVKAEDWDTMVDNGELFVRKGDDNGRNDE